MKNIETIYQKLIEKNYESSLEFYLNLNELLKQNQACFGDKPIPAFIRPYFIKKDQFIAIKRSIKIISDILEKFVKIYFKNKEIRDRVLLGHHIINLINKSSYQRNVFVARYDAFLNRNSLKFLEFNSDSPAGMGYSDAIDSILRQMEIRKQLEKYVKIEKVNRVNILLNMLLKNYKIHSGNNKKPVIAIVDWKNVKTLPEFYYLKYIFEKKGYKTYIGAPEEFDIIRNKVYLRNKRIDLIYRRVIINELLAKKNQVKNFLEICKNNSAYMFNPINSKLVSNKSILTVITNEKYKNFWTGKEREIIKKHIPWTRLIREGHKIYKGRKIDLIKFIIKNKDRFVIKPSDDYGGRGVTIGTDTANKEWERLINQKINSNWIVQEYVNIPEQKFPVLENCAIKFKKKKINLNPYVFDGKYAGMVTRLSENKIINVSAGGALVPALYYTEK